MSGFERSAPIPGSQGPRRSQMTRFNNAPPPESEWRKEVLEAKKQAEAAMRKSSQRESRSRSRDRDRERSDRDRRKGGAASSASASSSKKKEVKEDPDALAKKIIKAREVGEGWFAAVSAASSSWDSVPESKRPPVMKAAQEGHAGAAADKRKTDDRRKHESDARERERLAKDEKARLTQGLQEETERRAEQQREQERLEKQWQSEAEARERRRVEEKKKLEEDRRKKEAQESQRRKKLGNAFAVDGDSDDEAQKRDSQLLKKASERKRSIGDSTAVAAAAPAAQDTVAVPGSVGPSPKGDKELASKLGFEDALDPAEAFIRLQERKRKGRRAEFGGPPRGCSPWRDGKRGVITPIAQGRIDREQGSR